MKAAKRTRPRPNMIHVDMSNEIRRKLDECVAHVQATHNPFYGITQTAHMAIDIMHAKFFGKNKNNS